MATMIRQFPGFALLALVPAAASAQDVSATMDEAIDDYEQMAAEVSQFIGDVRFNESDAVY